MASPKNAPPSPSKKNGKEMPGSPPPPEPEVRRESAGEEEGKVDQIEAIFSKGLDLAEAGLSLGINLLSKIGAVAQDTLLSQFSPGGENGPAAAYPQGQSGPPQPRPQAPPEREQAPEEAEPEMPVGVMNRLALFPGSAVKVSFSINNDSPEAAKKVKLCVQGFQGQHRGAALDGSGFSLKPAGKTIEPMDFEKFYLIGEIPENLPSDLYHGAIEVQTDESFHIPVVLVVESRQ
ncbi:MAG TPA: hypothetical protein PLG66_05765 [Calditrichia bacterium]|nr:hypothetical protein [Calditrichia bacterium]